MTRKISVTLIAIAVLAVLSGTIAMFPIGKVYAQPSVEWSKTFGTRTLEEGYSVLQTSDGGYIIVGFTFSFGAGESDVYLIKTNANGEELWHRTFGGSEDDEGYSVQQTVDGGFIIAGWTDSFGAGGGDVYLVKTDSNGNELWHRTFEGDDGYSVQQTADRGYIIVGGSYDIRLIKTDSYGKMVWSKTYGGSEREGGYSVQQTSDGGYIIAGWTESFGAGSSDVYLIKTDSKGDEIWQKTFGGSNHSKGRSVQQTSDGGYIIAGGTSSFGAGYSDVYLIKTDSKGDEIWDETFGGSKYDWGWSVQQTSDGGYIIAGGTSSFGAGADDVYLIKLAPTQYKLRVLSMYGSVSGEGSFVEGSTISFSVSLTTVLGDSGIRYVFAGWTSDSLGGFTGSDNPAEVVMNGDITETAQWKKQYMLTVDSPVSIEGGGWYDEGSTATLRVVSPQGFLVQKVFQGWSGDIDSEAKRITLMIDGPKTVVAEWDMDYTQIYPLVGVVSVVVVSAGVLSMQRRHAEERKQARVKLKRTLIGELLRAEEAVQISGLSSEHGAQEEEVRTLIEEALKEGLIAGRFTMGNRRFITKTIMQQIIKRLIHAGEIVSISTLGAEHGISEALVRQLIDEALQEGALQGRYTNDEQRFITDAALQNIIRDKLRRS